MTKNEALKMAIETLEYLIRKGEPELVRTLLNCKEALAQPAQEPHGWVYEERIDDPEHPDGYYWSWGFSWIEIESGKPVYTHPAPSWQGLSDDEINKIVQTVSDDMYPWKGNMLIGKIIRAVEQALKEKNT